MTEAADRLRRVNEIVDLYTKTDALSVIRCHADMLGTKLHLPMSRQLLLDCADNLKDLADAYLAQQPAAASELLLKIAKTPMPPADDASSYRFQDLLYAIRDSARTILGLDPDEDIANFHDGFDVAKSLGIAQQPAPSKVLKPLEWRQAKHNDNTLGLLVLDYWFAASPFGRCEVWRHGDFYLWCIGESVPMQAESIEHGKSLCESRVAALYEEKA